MNKIFLSILLLLAVVLPSRAVVWQNYYTTNENPTISPGGKTYIATNQYFLTNYVTTLTYNTNSVILAGFSASGIDGTYVWTTDRYLKSANDFAFYLDSGFALLTNASGTLLVDSPYPDASTYSFPFYFPVVWEDAGAGGTIGTGNWASSNWVQLRLEARVGNSNAPTFFPSGILASNANLGVETVLTNASPLAGASGAMLGAIVSGYQNKVLADQAAIMGGGQNRINQRQGFIGGGNTTWIDTTGSTADSGAVGVEGSYINADASAIAGGLNSTNRAFRNTFMGGTWKSSFFEPGNSVNFGSAMVGVYESWAALGGGSLVSGKWSTNWTAGDSLISLGSGNLISNIFNSVNIGHNNRANTNAQFVGIFGFGNTLSQSNLIVLGFTNLGLQIDGTGGLTASSLAGTGQRFVQAGPSGNLIAVWATNAVSGGGGSIDFQTNTLFSGGLASVVSPLNTTGSGSILGASVLTTTNLNMTLGGVNSSLLATPNGFRVGTGNWTFDSNTGVTNLGPRQFWSTTNFITPDGNWSIGGSGGTNGGVAAPKGVTSSLLNPILTSNVSQNSATLQAITGLSSTLEAGAKYSFKMVLYVTNNVNAEGMKLDFNAGTATATAFRVHTIITDNGFNLSTNVGFLNQPMTTDNINGNTLVVSEGSITVNAAGTFQPQFAESTHTSGTITIFTGSHMVFQKH